MHEEKDSSNGLSKKRIMKNRLLFPIGSFQVRLLAYILLIGSIPLVCAMLVFYQQSSSYAEQELSDYVKQAHAQMLYGVSQSLSELDRTVKSMTSDYAVQRLLDRGGLTAEDERAYKEYLDGLLSQQMNQLNYIAAMCVTLDETGVSICKQEGRFPASSFDPPAAPLKKNERLLLSLKGREEQDDPIVKYVFALHDKKSNVVKGTITVLIRMDRLVPKIQFKQPVDNLVLYDDRGSVLYRMSPAALSLDVPSGTADFQQQTKVVADTIVSRQRLDLNGLYWYSQLELRNLFPSSTYRSLRSTVIVLFLVLLMLSLASSFVFARFVIKPLHHLKSLMKRAERGDLKAYWIASGTTEMNDLGNSYNQMLNRLEELIKQVKREEGLKKEAEIAALQYQLNPHFLYNTLNTIKWVAKIHKTPQISEVVTALVRLLQASLGKKGDFLTIREEIGLLQDYMEIQRFRYGDKVTLAFDIDPIASCCLVPRMILQPLVENAIIHGIEPGGRDGHIIVKAWIERDILFCQVEDNGVGFSPGESDAVPKPQALKERMSGIGLHHIREKIKLYYGSDYKMYVFSNEQQGTTVRLTLPIHQSEG